LHLIDFECAFIENFNVPDVFMKTKYDSVSQYNYEIQEQNESEHDENAPQKHDDGRKSKDIPLAKTKRQGRADLLTHADHYRGDEENRASPYAPVKKPVTSSTNIRKKSKFNHAYNDGNDGAGETAHSQILQQSIQSKSKLAKGRSPTMPNEGEGEFEISTTYGGQDQQEGQHQSNGQLPYISKRHGAEKAVLNAFDAGFDPQKMTNAWKGGKHANAGPAAEGGDGEVRHYNIIYNNNTYNYNVSASPWNAQPKRKI